MTQVTALLGLAAANQQETNTQSDEWKKNNTKAKKAGVKYTLA